MWEPWRYSCMASACAAMFLARLGGTRPWHLIAIELGLPAWHAQEHQGWRLEWRGALQDALALLAQPRSTTSRRTITVGGYVTTA